jgi:hypothetical protein
MRHSIGNFALNFRGDDLPEKAVLKAFANPHFRLFFMDGDSPIDLSDRAEAEGLRMRYELTGMGLSRLRGNERLELLRAKDADDARNVAAFMADTFFWQSPRASRHRLAQIMCSCFPRHEFYSLLDDHGIAAAGTLTLDGEVIGLYNLCVRHDLRSQGLGTRLTTELSRLAQPRADHVVLLCGEDLIPWYARIGYEKVGSLLAYSA